MAVKALFPTLSIHLHDPRTLVLEIAMERAQLAAEEKRASEVAAICETLSGSSQNPSAQLHHQLQMHHPDHLHVILQPRW